MNIRIFIVIIILIGFNPGRISATHLAGAGITYTCVGTDSIQVDFVFYRDCNSTSTLPNSVGISFSSASCNINFNDTLSLSPGTGQEVFFTCQDLPTICSDSTSFFPGIQEYKYSGIVYLPTHCSDWIISWLYCCRSCNITNIILPSPCVPGTNPPIYIYATLDNLNYNCNSSPHFANAPIIFACVGDTLTYSHGSSDADGDSLVYSLVDPLSNFNTPLVFNPGYSAANPLTSSPALSIDQLTGDIMMRPTQIQVAVMAVLIEEYRNGIRISELLREMTVYVRQMSLNLPIIDQNEVTIFPNPITNGDFNVRVNTSGIVNISLLDIFGRLIFSQETIVNNSSDQIPIHLHNFAKGIYFCRVAAKGVTYLRKVEN